MACWLVKTEPGTYSIDDLSRDRVTPWDGVRNYQARNFLQSMQPGDQVLIYHSSAEQIGVAGLGKIKKKAYPDPLQFDKRSKYFDETAKKDEPRWFCPDIEIVRKFDEIVPLKAIKDTRGLEKMELLKKGSRLSVQPVTEKEFEIIVGLAE